MLHLCQYKNRIFIKYSIDIDKDIVFIAFKYFLTKLKNYANIFDFNGSRK